MLTSALNVRSCIKQRSDSRNITSHCRNVQRRGLPTAASMDADCLEAKELWQIWHLC